MAQLKLSVVDEQLINQIIDEAMQLLADPGVRVHNQDALDLLAQAGASVDFEFSDCLYPGESGAKQCIHRPQRVLPLRS